jgi:hypothetical protein
MTRFSALRGTAAAALVVAQARSRSLPRSLTGKALWTLCKCARAQRLQPNRRRRLLQPRLRQRRRRRPPRKRRLQQRRQRRSPWGARGAAGRTRSQGS